MSDAGKAIGWCWGCAMSSHETPLMKELQAAASRLGARLFRQNTGKAWIGKADAPARIAKTVRLAPGDVVVRNARMFHAGFEGWSDLGGWAPVTITPDMIGKTVAVYVQAEVKDKGRATDAQLRWIDAVNRAGGIGGVIRSEDDLRALLSKSCGHA